MKNVLGYTVLFMTIIFVVASCKKTTTYDPQGGPAVSRKVQFSLYTDKDFSDDNHKITFKLSIQNSSNQTLWDSSLAPMKIKDIPGLANKLAIKKSVSYDSYQALKVAFYYSIENVGTSSHVESFNAGETLKIFDFNFQ